MRRETTPRWVDSPTALQELADELAEHDVIGLDCEADSLHAYPEKLCLLQVALGRSREANARATLIDPLVWTGTDLDPEPLGAWVHAVGQKKLLLHGADFDLRLLYRTFAMVPQHLFDTMEAARLLGWREVGLRAVVERVTGVRLQKGSQRANWARRPLTPKMIAYASNDVAYLPQVAEYLERELRARGRLAWHHETCTRTVEAACCDATADPSRVWRVKGSRKLGRHGLAVLRELWHVRERAAVRFDRPPYFVIAHESLIEASDRVASDPQVEGREVAQMIGVRGRVAREIAEAVQRVRALAPADYPKRHRVTPRPQLDAGEQRRLADLRKTRDAQAESLAIEPTLIASKAALVAVARGRVPERMMSWQRELLRLPE